MSWTPQKLTIAQKQERREEALRMLSSKSPEYTAREVARELGVSEAAVSQWKTRAEKGKLSAIPKSGAPSKLSLEQRQKLKAMLLESPQAHGYDRLGWTATIIADLIERTFGVVYNSKYVAAMLHGLGMSVQRPKTRSQRRDDLAIATWKSKTYPELKKSTPTTPRSSQTKRTRV